jgi:putative hydrolase of the HAD superfamily
MKVLFWDFNDTLGYRRGGWLGAMYEAVNKKYPGTSLTIEDFRPYVTSGFPWHTPEVEHTELNNSFEQWWELFNQRVFNKAYASLGFKDSMELSRLARLEFTDIKTWELFDDVIPVLSQLKEQGWIHVIMSNHIPELKDIIKQLKLDKLISDTINSADVGYEKPNPKIFKLALDKYSADEMWMIGDNAISDIKGAEDIGIKGILVRKYYDNINLKFKDLYELRNFLCNTADKNECVGMS